MFCAKAYINTLYLAKRDMETGTVKVEHFLSSKNSTVNKPCVSTVFQMIKLEVLALESGMWKYSVTTTVLKMFLKHKNSSVNYLITS
jgi:hypothetical protein